MGLTRNSETHTCGMWYDVCPVFPVFASWGVDEVLGKASNPTHCTQDKLNLLSGIWTELVAVALPAMQQCIKSNQVDATKQSDLHCLSAGNHFAMLCDFWYFWTKMCDMDVFNHWHQKCKLASSTVTSLCWLPGWSPCTLQRLSQKKSLCSQAIRNNLGPGADTFGAALYFACGKHGHGKVMIQVSSGRNNALCWKSNKAQSKGWTEPDPAGLVLPSVLDLLVLLELPAWPTQIDPKEHSAATAMSSIVPIQNPISILLTLPKTFKFSSFHVQKALLLVWAGKSPRRFGRMPVKTWLHQLWESLKQSHCEMLRTAVGKHKQGAAFCQEENTGKAKLLIAHFHYLISGNWSTSCASYEVRSCQSLSASCPHLIIAASTIAKCLHCLPLWRMGPPVGFSHRQQMGQPDL